MEIGYLQEILALYMYSSSKQKQEAGTRKTITELFCHEYDCLLCYNIPDTPFSICMSNSSSPLPSSVLAQIMHFDHRLMFSTRWQTDLKQSSGAVDSEMSGLNASKRLPCCI